MGGDLFWLIPIDLFLVQLLTSNYFMFFFRSFSETHPQFNPFRKGPTVTWQSPPAARLLPLLALNRFTS